MGVPRIGLLGLCVLLLSLLIPAKSGSAQDKDTTVVAFPDSLIQKDSLNVPDSLLRLHIPPVDSSLVEKVVLPPITFLDLVQGIAVGDTLPSRHISLDPQGILAELPGTFLYDFGSSGWPDGWSPYGLSPNEVNLSFNDIPYNDPSSGLPQYELLPLAMLQLVQLQTGRRGNTVGVNTRLRSFDHGRPLTEINYRSSNRGLQSALITHTQKRRLNLFDIPGSIGFTLAYGGHGANGEYSGSKLEAARQLFVRLRYQNAKNSLELLNLNNRRRLGAHAGVVPGTGSTGYIGIFNRFNAQVVNPNAQRQTLRNDLALTFRRPFLGDREEPFSATGYWTAHTFRYFNSSSSTAQDTLQARTSRFGYRLSQTFSLASGHLVAGLEGWTEQVREERRDSSTFISALPDSLGIQRTALHAYANAQWRLGPLHLEVSPALYVHPTFSTPGGEARITFLTSGTHLFASVSHTASLMPLATEYGWGDSLVPISNSPSPTTTSLRVGGGIVVGPLDFSMAGFYHSTADAFDYFTNLNTETVEAITFSNSIERTGASIDIGLRRLAEKGFYLTATSTVHRELNATDTPTLRTLSKSLPELFAQGRFGMRYRIFRGDLDFDLYARGRYWPSFLSRTLHPETGLLVLRDETDRSVDASATFDVMLEAGVRTAKFFIGFENLLSGTTVIIGNLLVPDYPLPERRFRFGVYWPIWN